MELIEMRHPRRPATALTSREAFKQIWEPKGWTLVGEEAPEEPVAPEPLKRKWFSGPTEGTSEDEESDDNGTTDT